MLNSNLLSKLVPLFILVAVLFVPVSVITSVASASIPTRISYEGRLVDTAGNPVTTTKAVTFKIYDGLTGGTALWTSSTYNIVPESHGTFSALLGSNSDPINALVFNGSDAYLELTIAGETLAPRMQLVTAPYAFKSSDSDNLAGVAASNYLLKSGGTLTGGITVTGIVTADAFSGDGSKLTGIAAASIADGSVTTSKIADASVTDAKIVSISGSKVVGTTLPGAHASSHQTGGTDVVTVDSTMANFNYAGSSSKGGAATSATTAITANLLATSDAAGQSAIAAINSATAGNVSDSRLSTNVTTQGNSFNAPGKLIQLDGTAKLPAVDGSNLTGITVTNGVLTTESYADPAWITLLAGSKISGNISGNAATATSATSANNATTVTNGVYSNGSYADPAWITSLAGSKISGVVTAESANTFKNKTISDTNNSISLSAGTIPNLDASKITTGTLASGILTGSYSIDISGNAATATSATSANNATTVTNGVYSNGSYADPAWITSLAGSKISGVVTAESVNTFKNKTISDTNNSISLSAGTIPNLDASKITTGTLPDAILTTNVVTLDAVQTLTNKTISATSNTLTNLGVLSRITLPSLSPYTVPADVTVIEVELIGGGGGGAGGTAITTNTKAAAGGGGGGGAYTSKRIATSGGSTFTFVVGTGGAGGSPGSGSVGGQTQFDGTSITANGGGGGTTMASGSTILTASGGAGGAAGTTGDVNIDGSTGGSGYRMSGTLGISGAGGASLYGSQSICVYVPTTAIAVTGTAGALYGSGGAGGACFRISGTDTTATGGVGANGVIIIHEYK
ncbi:MAG: hypothetical protein NTZ10_00920 [Candidatus Saganbacteria bacterium]|nr:hypothetical protein [Candidatus Saganbacteria bacterium]